MNQPASTTVEMDDETLKHIRLLALMYRLPLFDRAWPPETQNQWLTCFAKLQRLTEPMGRGTSDADQTCEPAALAGPTP